MSPTRNYNGTLARCFRGFSLAELMIAMSISMVVIAALLSSYTFLGRNLVRYSNQQQLETQSRRMLQMFSQDVHMATDVPSFSANQVILRLPNGTSGTSFFDVAYAYNTNAGTYSVTLLKTDDTTGTYSYTTTATGTLTRIDYTNGALTLLTGISTAPVFSFTYLDQQGVTLTPSSTYAFRIKQIEVANFIAISGTASAGTQSSFTGASARFVLRNKYLIPKQNGQIY